MKIAVYCGSALGNDPDYEKAARTLGNWIGTNGHTLVYGGAKVGLMGAVANETLLAGGKVIGVLPDIPLIQGRRHPGLTEYIETADMAARRTKMIELADAFVALPGGPGTLDELSEILALTRLGQNQSPLVLVNTGGYYASLREFLEKMREAEFAEEKDLRCMLVSEDMEEIGTFLTCRAFRI